MKKTTFGRTGLEVTVMGLGGGGPSRLGVRDSESGDEPRAVVRAALEGGINIFDTAESYRTEPIMGAVLKDVPRDSVVIATKAGAGKDGRPRTLAEVESALDQSLKNLGTDHLDLVLSRGFISKLVSNARITRYIEMHHAEFLPEFEKITEAEALTS